MVKLPKSEVVRLQKFKLLVEQGLVKMPKLVCVNCLRRFQQKGELRKHMEKIHKWSKYRAFRPLSWNILSG